MWRGNKQASQLERDVQTNERGKLKVCGRDKRKNKTAALLLAYQLSSIEENAADVS